MIPLTDKAINNMRWKPVDGKKIDKLLEGLTVIGAEPIDYPDTDGITIYFRDRDGSILALETGIDLIDTEPEDNPFYATISRAKNPERIKRT